MGRYYQLKELERDGIVLRTEYLQVPSRMEYSLTEMGQWMMPILNSLCRWAASICPRAGMIQPNNRNRRRELYSSAVFYMGISQ